MRAVVIGGGISGLSLSWFLRKYMGQTLKSVKCIEASSNPGGWAKSKRVGKNGRFLFEIGPHSMRPVGPQGRAIVELIEGVGLEKEALVASNASKNRYLWVNGKINKMPSSIPSLFTNPITYQLPFLALKEILTVKKCAENDESIHSFFTRHFNKRTADIIADSILTGIFAGNIHNLSVRSCLKVVYEMEKKDRSVVLSILKSAFKGGNANEYMDIVKTEEGRKLLGASSVSFEHGMQQLTDEMARKINSNPEDEVLLNTKVDLIAPGDTGNKVNINLTQADGSDAKIEADMVFSTVPIRSLCQALPSHLSAHLQELNESIKFVSVGLVNLGYNDARLPYNGFGHLIPSNQWEGVLGMIYDSLVFPKQMKGDQGSTLTVMMGGANFPEKANLSEADMIEFACEKVKLQLGINAIPDEAMATRHVDCIPQYPVGHHDRMTTALSNLKQEFPSLRVLGNNFHGVGIADSVFTAKTVAEEATQLAKKMPA